MTGRRSTRPPQGGPAMSGSIQQEFIEKLWVAILTYDASASAEASLPTKVECEEKESGDSSTSDDDNDDDVNLSDDEGGYTFVNLGDLYSQAARSNCQGKSTVSHDDINFASVKDFSAPRKQSLGVKNSGERYGLVELKTQSDTRMSASLQANMDVIIDRPLTRPKSLNLGGSLARPSKIPQWSPLSPVSPMGGRNIGATQDSPDSPSISKGKQSKSRVYGQRFVSKIPVSPSLGRKMSIARDRLGSDPLLRKSKVKISSQEIITCSRRAITPDPKPFKQRPRGVGISKSTDMNRSTGKQDFAHKNYRKGDENNITSVPKANAVKRSNTLRSSFKFQKESGTTNKAKETRRAESPVKSVVQNIKKRIAAGNTKIPVKGNKLEKSSKSTSDNTNPREKSYMNTTQDSGFPRVTRSLNREEIKKRNQYLVKAKGEAREKIGNWCRENMKENCSTLTKQAVKKQDSLDHKVSSKSDESRVTGKLCRRGNVSSIKRTQSARQASGRGETKEQQNLQRIRSPTRGKNGKRCPPGDSKFDLESETNPKETGSPPGKQGKDTNHEKELMEPSCLEGCLKEAILGVLQGLPEGWILVPDHTAELFSSLTSVIDSFPRPLHAHIRVVEAIMDAHNRRPCSKGEIPALNNAHLLLYIALKLCCVRGQLQRQEHEENGQVPSTTGMTENEAKSQIIDGKLKQIGGRSGMDEEWCKQHEALVVKILTEVLECEGSFDRLMMCLLLGSRAPGRGSGWYCESDAEIEKVLDLRFVLDHARFIAKCRVSEIVSAPLWSCGSTPVVVAALAESPKLVLTLLQYGAGGSTLNYYLYSKCYTDGVYLSIAYLVRKLEGQYRDVYAHPQSLPSALEDDLEDQLEDGSEYSCTPKDDVLSLAGSSPTAACLRYLLRAVPQVPPKFLRDHVSGCLCDAPALLPRQCCLDPPTLVHLARVACRRDMRSRDLLPHAVDLLNIPPTLKDSINLLRG